MKKIFFNNKTRQEVLASMDKLQNRYTIVAPKWKPSYGPFVKGYIAVTL